MGIFTLINALIHFIIGYIISTKKLADKSLFYLVSGLVMVFVTIAIPVQLDGNWVTLLWITESVLLFWIGKTKNITFYLKISYPMMIIALFSLFHDWQNNYGNYNSIDIESKIIPIFNIHFLTSLYFIIGFSYITYLNFNKKFNANESINFNKNNTIKILISFCLIFVTFFALYLEIENYWLQRYLDLKFVINDNINDFNAIKLNQNMLYLKTIWLTNYSIIFAIVLIVLNIKKAKNYEFGLFNLILTTVLIFVFLTYGLFTLSELRENCLTNYLSEYFPYHKYFILIRYLCIGIAVIGIYSMYKLIKSSFMKIDFVKYFDYFLILTSIWIISSELLNIFDILKITNSYKLGLSILWGLCSLSIIIYGIWKNKQHLRFVAIILFGITLLKLFFYDISHLNTISKTIIFIILGILLLIISFLYNKYKNKIYDEPKI